MISALSGSHSFDSKQMNLSHVISHFSFGMKVLPRVMSDAKRLLPYIGRSHDRLNGRSFINHRDVGANVTVSSFASGSLNLCFVEFCSLHVWSIHQHFSM